MNLSDKIVYKDLDGFSDEFVWKKDVRKAVRELKRRIKEEYGRGTKADLDEWIDEIFGERLI